MNINSALNETLSFSNSTKRLLTEIELVDNSINLYLFNANELSEKKVFSLAQQYLSTSEFAIYDQRKALLAKKEFIASRLLLKHLAFAFFKSLNASLLPVDFKELIILFNKELSCLEVRYQQQLLPLTVSLSHSHGIVFLGVAQHKEQHSKQQHMPLETKLNMQLGVDIELISEKRNHQKLAKHFFHPAEIDWITAQGQTAFFRVWTLKEALAKASKVSVASLLAKNVFEQLRSVNRVSYFSCQYQSQVSKNIFDMSIVFNMPLKVKAIHEVDLKNIEHYSEIK
ncbi:MAG: 4'-phosphopantetheinyl transferase superfamily protein [Colwellia sp.]